MSIMNMPPAALREAHPRFLDYAALEPAYTDAARSGTASIRNS